MDSNYIYKTRNGIFRTEYVTRLPLHKLHCLDGPAVIDPHGGKEWWIDGKLHRLDGPAIIVPGIIELWYIHGEDRTLKIKKWIEEKGLPNWKLWNNETKLLFKLVWG